MLRKFWADEFGAVVSAELVTVGTLAVIGTTAGVSVVSRAVNDELSEVAQAIRSLDQSYTTTGYSSPYARSAGSRFVQTPVAESLQDLTGVSATEGPLKPEGAAKDVQSPDKNSTGPVNAGEKQPGESQSRNEISSDAEQERAASDAESKLQPAI